MGTEVKEYTQRVKTAQWNGKTLQDAKEFCEALGVKFRSLNSRGALNMEITHGLQYQCMLVRPCDYVIISRNKRSLGTNFQKYDHWSFENMFVPAMEETDPFEKMRELLADKSVFYVRVENWKKFIDLAADTVEDIFRDFFEDYSSSGEDTVDHLRSIGRDIENWNTGRKKEQAK